jgi:serine protease inhibitor
LDRPFLYFIKDSLTGMILFQGRVCDPSSADDAPADDAPAI